MRKAPSHHLFYMGLALAAALAGAPARAADAPAKPTAKQLAGLCDSCVIVTAQAVEKRKGKAGGVGAVGGAVAGGVVGNKVGDSTMATVGGAAVGGLLGNEIEKRVKRHKVWITEVTQKDGKTRRFEALADPQYKLGDTLKVQGDQLARP